MVKKFLKRIYPFSILFQMKSDIQKLKDCNKNLINQNSNYREQLEKKSNQIQDLKNQIQDLKKQSQEMNQNLKKQTQSFERQIQKLNEAFEYKNNGLTNQLNSRLYQLNRKTEYLYYKGLQPNQYESALKDWYYEKTGKELDLNHPVTYNEKMQWLKLYDKNPMLSLLADKYEVRNYVKNKIGDKYLIPLIAVYDSVEEIDFDVLPQKYVMKANHGCGYNIIVKDKNEVNQDQNRRKLKEWMQTDFSFVNGFELQYSNIKRKIIVEEYIENLNNDLYDYKVFCFNGKAKYIMFLSERKQKLKMQFYDLEWNLQPFVYSYERKNEEIEKPDNLDELIKISEELAAGFLQVRVDFYRLNSGEWKFGEMTFTSSSGMGKWDPPIYDKILGELFELPNQNERQEINKCRD